MAAFVFYGGKFVDPLSRPPHPPTTPNISKVDSGTLRQALRAAILSTPYSAIVSILATISHVTTGCAVKIQPVAAKMSSK